MSASMFDERLTTAAMDRSMLPLLLLLLLLQLDTRRGTVPICENLNLKFLFIYTHAHTHTHVFTHVLGKCEIRKVAGKMDKLAV